MLSSIVTNKPSSSIYMRVSSLFYYCLTSSISLVILIETITHRTVKNIIPYLLTKHLKKPTIHNMIYYLVLYLKIRKKAHIKSNIKFIVPSAQSTQNIY